MLKFSDLTNSQKQFIVALIEFDEKFKTEGKITRQECISIPEQLNAAHATDKFVRPRWLRANSMERGAYELPLPTEFELLAFGQTSQPVESIKTEVQQVVAEVSVAEVSEDEADDEEVGGSRLFKVIEDSEVYDEDVEEFNQILRDFGIEV